MHHKNISTQENSEQIADFTQRPLKESQMLLHHQFVRIAKQFENKIAIIDRTTNTRLTYGKALIGALMLSEKLKKYDEGLSE